MQVNCQETVLSKPGKIQYLFRIRSLHKKLAVGDQGIIDQKSLFTFRLIDIIYIADIVVDAHVDVDLRP